MENEIVEIFNNSSRTISSLIVTLEKIREKYGDQYLAYDNVKIIFDGYASSLDQLEPQFKVVIEYTGC
jgi:hypothetical protein